MRILYVTQYYPPETCAPAARVSELARYWVRAGHDVTVLTGFPNHPTGVLHQEYRSKIRRGVVRECVDGVDIIRTWLWPLPNRKSVERILNYSSFWASSSLAGVALRRPDIVIGTSPQLLVGLSGWSTAVAKRVPYIFEVRDLWPESLAAVGASSDRSAMVRVLGAIAGFLYRRSNHIVAVTPAFKTELMANWRVPSEKISVVQNGVETHLFTPDGDCGDWRERLGLQDRFVAGYIGTIGNAHGVDTLLEAASRLSKTHSRVAFLFVGAGAERERVVQQAESMKLGNVFFLPPQPRELVPSLVRACDACLVPLRRSEVFKTVIPTKMLEFMACGRPVVLSVEGQAQQIVEDANGGLVTPPEDAEAIAAALVRLHDDPALAAELGRSGRDYIVRNMAREGTAELYLDVLRRVIAEKAVNPRKNDELA